MPAPRAKAPVRLPLLSHSLLSSIGSVPVSSRPPTSQSLTTAAASPTRSFGKPYSLVHSLPAVHPSSLLLSSQSTQQPHSPFTPIRPFTTSPSPSSKSSSSTRWRTRQLSDPYTREAKVQGLKSRAAFKLLELDSKYRLFRRNAGQVIVDLGFAPGSWSQVAVDRTAPDGRVVGIDIIPAQPPKGVSTIQGNFLSPGVQRMVKQLLVEGERRRRIERKERRGREREMRGQGEGEGEGEVVVEQESYLEMERKAAMESEMVAREEEEANLEDGKNLRLVDVVLSDMSDPWPQTHGFSVNSLSNPHHRMMNTSGIAFKDHAGSMDLCRAALSFASDTLKPGGHFVCKFYQGAEDKAFEQLLKKMFAKVHREKPYASRPESKEAFFVALRRKGDVTLQDIEKQSGSQ